MAKSIRSKAKRKWRAIKYDKYEHKREEQLAKTLENLPINKKKANEMAVESEPKPETPNNTTENAQMETEGSTSKGLSKSKLKKIKEAAKRKKVGKVGRNRKKFIF
eukprot:Clim_evm140s210 gene=Clim_evmTU140s210